MKPDPLVSMTLGQAARELIYLVECKDCKHRTRIDLREMARRYGDDDPLARLKVRLKCGQCGTKEFIITTYWLSASASGAVLKKWPLAGD